MVQIMGMTAEDYARDEFHSSVAYSEIQDMFNDEFNDIFSRLEALEQKLEQSTNTQAIDTDILPNNSIKAVTKLLYALLKEHGYTLDGAKKGATNEQLLNLTQSHNVGINRATIATWLERVNDLQADLHR